MDDGQVKVTTDGKLHTEESCPYLDRADDPISKPIAVYPENHRDICSWCESKNANYKQD